MSVQWLDKAKELAARRYRQYFGVQPLSVSQADIESWFSNGIGQRILRQEQQLLDNLLPEFFGYHLMQMSVLRDVKLYEQSSTSYQFALNPSFNDSSEEDNALVSSFEQLPIEADTIDVALLHHALEFSVSPHQLLRETARVVIPNGVVIIVGFNPFSPMGAIKPCACLVSRSQHWRYHHLRVARLVDWFHMLDLELIKYHRGYFGLPLNGLLPEGFCGEGKLAFLGKVLNRCSVPLFGRFYLLVARKTIASSTIVKASWKQRRGLAQWGKGVVVPSVTGPSSRIVDK